MRSDVGEHERRDSPTDTATSRGGSGRSNVERFAPIAIKGLAALMCLFWGFVLADLVGEITSGVPGLFYWLFATGNAVAIVGAVLALRWTLVGGIVAVAGSLAVGAAGVFRPDVSIFDPGAHFLGMLLFAAPAFMIGALLIGAALLERKRS